MSATDQPKSVVSVPREPTREMLNAAIDVDAFKLGDISPLGFRISPQMLFEKCWSAMIAAAPLPQGEGDKGNHDCLAKRRPGEPMFILLGRDPDAHNIVRTWAERRLAAGGDPEHCRMGLDTAERMKAYAADPANAPASAPPASAYAALAQPAPAPQGEDGWSAEVRESVAKAVEQIANAAIRNYCLDQTGFSPEREADAILKLIAAARSLPERGEG